MSSSKTNDDAPDAVTSAAYGYETDDGIAAPPGKKPRGEDQVEKLIGYDTDLLASAGRHDETILNKLDDFSHRLQESIRAVKYDRADDEKRKREKERAVQAELAKKKLEEKTKKFKQRVAEKKCFKCKEVKGLYGCVYLKRYQNPNPYFYRPEPGGVLLCEKCREEVTEDYREDYKCSLCQGFLHSPLGEGLCCSTKCSSRKGITCKNCDQFYCEACGGEQSLQTYEGDNWWCDECTFDIENNVTIRCRSCEKEALIPGNHPLVGDSDIECSSCTEWDDEYRIPSF